MVVGLYPHFWRLNSIIANIPQLMEVIIIVIPCYTIVIATTVCNIYIYTVYTWLLVWNSRWGPSPSRGTAVLNGSRAGLDHFLACHGTIDVSHGLEFDGQWIADFPGL